jgi:hypothetical protein
MYPGLRNCIFVAQNEDRDLRGKERGRRRLKARAATKIHKEATRGALGGDPDPPRGEPQPTHRQQVS